MVLENGRLSLAMMIKQDILSIIAVTYDKKVESPKAREKRSETQNVEVILPLQKLIKKRRRYLKMKEAKDAKAIEKKRLNLK